VGCKNRSFGRPGRHGLLLSHSYRRDVTATAGVLRLAPPHSWGPRVSISTHGCRPGPRHPDRLRPQREPRYSVAGAQGDRPLWIGRRDPERLMLPREDFLKGSLYTKLVNGVRIGVFDGGGYQTHCNFHGSVTDIRTSGGLFRLESVLLPADGERYSTTRDLYVKLDVLRRAAFISSCRIVRKWFRTMRSRR